MGESVRFQGPLNLRERWLCLELCNRSVDWHARERPTEHLNDYRDLIAWGHEVGLLDPDLQSRLLDLASERPADAHEALHRVRDLREICYRIFADIAHRRCARTADVAGLNRCLAHALPGAALTPTDAGFVWSWQALDLDWALWPVARSAADLLTSDELDRVGQCADDRGCGWLFVDTTRGRRRRWCSMETCGNRAKQLRHIQRARAEKDA